MRGRNHMRVPGEPENVKGPLFKKNRGNTCEYCDGGRALVIGKTNDQGIAVKYPNLLLTYGYDIHGTGSNGLCVGIRYCPMCGKRLAL